MTNLLPSTPGRKPILLIIDDNTTNLKIALEYLQHHPYELLTAREGETGLTRAQEAQPDLILLDVQMPGLDGFETCRRLKADPRTADIPVIFMTALADIEDKVRGFEAGGVDYLVKPLDAQELRARVSTHVKLRALQVQAQRLNTELRGVVQQMAQRQQELSLLNTLSEVLQTCQTSDEAYAAIQRYAARLFPAESGTLYWLEPKRNLLEAVTQWGEAAAAETLFAAHECWALRQGRIHLVNDVNSDLPCVHVNALAGAPAAYICAPLSAGELLGLFHVRSANGPLTNAQQELVETLAKQLALALANLKLRETLRQQSIRDALTGLFNRRYLEETLEREIYRAVRSGGSVGIIMLDIDHFKRFNDTHGHEAGDAVLKTLGEFLRAHIRAGDIPCRYGGEEFTLILPTASVEIAAQRAEALRAKAEGLAVTAQGKALGPITLSLGVAAFPQHSPTGMGVVQIADEALYQSKKAGRNRVTVA